MKLILDHILFLLAYFFLVAVILFGSAMP